VKDQSTKKDLLWFSVVAIAILAFGSIPFWIAKSVETNKLVFLGAYFDEADYAVHISMMQAGRMGEWTYQIRFTSEEHRAAFVRMFYIILGHASKWSGLNVETTFHIARWFFGFIALYSIYQLCRKIFPNQIHARTAFLLSALGAGTGWLQLMLGAPLEPISPIDFWLIDAYIFFSISLFPSFSFSLALMASALNLFLFFLDSRKWQTVAFICLLAVVSQITNPIAFAAIDAAFVGTTLSFWWKNREIESRHLFALFIIAFAQIPLLTYNFLILARDPFWSQFTYQNQTLSPPPSFYVWGFAPFWIFAIYGMVITFRERNSNMAAMTAWVISGFTLAYIPVFIQRRFILGITIPLGILAIYGLSHLIKLISTKLPNILNREKLAYFTYILLASISSIYLSLGSGLFMQTQPAEKFNSRDLENALVWLNENAKPDDFVLADIKTSQLVAQRTSLRVYVGHQMETIYFEDKKLSMIAYFQGNSPKGWLTQTRAQWVIYGQYEKEISSSFAPRSELKLAYKNETVTIYKVRH